MASPGLLSQKEDSKEKEMLKTKTFNNLFFMKEVKRKLTIKEREIEIASMLSGKKISSSAIKHARELLD